MPIIGTVGVFGNIATICKFYHHPHTLQLPLHHQHGGTTPPTANRGPHLHWPPRRLHNKGPRRHDPRHLQDTDGPGPQPNNQVKNTLVGVMDLGDRST